VTIATLQNRSEALDIARALVPAIRERAAQAESDRCIPKETIADLRQSGLFNLLTPKVLGGSELGFVSLVEITAELATACGSTGWVFGVLAGHSWLLNLFPEAAQRDVLAASNALSATVFRLGGKASRVDGGYRLVNGEGRFCSGIDHAGWVMVGNAVQNPDGSQEPRFFLVPRADLTIVDDWFTAGMRGTGSRSIRISDAFVPEHRSVRVQDMLEGTAPGAKFLNSSVYRTPFQDVTPFSLIGAPLGIAKAALNAFSEGLKASVAKLSGEALAAQSATFARLAVASSDVDAAYALVLEDANRIDAAGGTLALSLVDRARLPRDWAYAAQTSRHAVNRLFEASGGGGVYDSSELQRVWRDANSAAQHFAFTWDSAMTNFGRAALGLSASQLGPRNGR
jgi:alkylation response protein AidB-like acyl-CoA dehydrogenase